MAHFLVDASLPRATAELICSCGHQATDVRDLGLAAALDPVIAEHAKSAQLCLITRDGDFGNVLDYPPQDYFGIVVVQTPEAAPRSVVLEMVERFLREPDVVENLPGRLAVVEPARIRVRTA